MKCMTSYTLADIYGEGKEEGGGAILCGFVRFRYNHLFRSPQLPINRQIAKMGSPCFRARKREREGGGELNLGSARLSSC